MGKRIEDLKETAPCGMLIHYTVNEEDMQSTNSLSAAWKRFSRIPQDKSKDMQTMHIKQRECLQINT